MPPTKCSKHGKTFAISLCKHVEQALNKDIPIDIVHVCIDFFEEYMCFTCFELYKDCNTWEDIVQVTTKDSWNAKCIDCFNEYLASHNIIPLKHFVNTFFGEECSFLTG